MIARVLLLLVWAAALLAAGPAQSQTMVSVIATPAFEGNYVPGTWLPITLSITNDGPPVSARISAELPQGAASYVQDRQLAGGEPQRVVLYVPMMQETREIRLTIAAGNTVLAEQTVAVRPRTDERMLGIIASEDLRLSLPRREDLASLPFNALRIDLADLPDRAEGLESLGLLLIYNLLPDSLSPAQIGALRSWVNAGGHLIIGGGPEARAVNDWLPKDLQAATIGADQQIGDAPLAELADAPGPGSLSAAQLIALPGGVSVGPADAPAWVARSVGKGKVTQLAFDPGMPELRDWGAAPQFWDKLLQPALLVSTSFGLQTNVTSLQEQTLAGALTALPTVSQPPIDRFFLMLILYTIVIGPVIALALRRIDRQAWSWLIVPALAVGSGALLITVALNLRADSRVITQVSLVEYLGDDQARARTFVGILAPREEVLFAQLPDGALARPVQSISGLYGSIGGVSGPMLQESEQLGIHVDPWVMQGLVAEQQVPLVGIDAEIVFDDQGARVRVRNQTDQRLTDVVAVYGEQVVQLGSIRQGEEVSGRWPPTMDLAPPGTAISAIILRDAIAEAQLPGRAAERRTQVRAAMINAAVIAGIAATDPGPLILAWMEKPPLDVAVEAPGAARQSQSLLVIHPPVRGSGIIDLPQGWLRADLGLSHGSACFSSNGAGVTASPAPVTISLRLPNDLSPLRASALSLSMDSSNTWPNAGVTTELYDWERAAWVEHPFDGPGELRVDSPETYLFQGRLMLRLSGAIERAGCIYIHTKLQGSMP